MHGISLLFHDVYVRDPAESGFRSDAADRYKLSLADFDAQLEGVARARSDAPVVIGGSTAQTGGSMVHGANAAPWNPPHRDHLPHRDELWGRFREADPPYLMAFDDGGVSYHTLIADRLEARGWRGHCFVATDFVGASGFLDAAQIRDLDARGHVIGSHSASHPARFSARPFDEMVAEWSRSRQVLEDMLGHAIDVASVPGGYFSPAVARAARAAGIRILFTSEPVTAIAPGPDCTLIGRFTIRHGHAADTAQRFVAPAPWARTAAWAGWSAKAVVKPLLGSSYIRIADWLHALRRPVTS